MDKEKLFTLLKSPIITEQTAILSESLKQIVFKVDLDSTKREIKMAVEKLFKVKVLKVTTSIVKGKNKRNRFGVYKKSNYVLFCFSNIVIEFYGQDNLAYITKTFKKVMTFFNVFGTSASFACYVVGMVFQQIC